MHPRLVALLRRSGGVQRVPHCAVLAALRSRGFAAAAAADTPAPAAAAAAAAAPADAPAAAASPAGGGMSAERPHIPGNIYEPRTAYPSEYTTAESNPAKHTYADVGRYFALAGGDAATIAATFPEGLAGDLATEFEVTGTNMMCVRPSGVYLVQLLEHWRQVQGRALAAAGEAVLDIDASAPYEPPDLGLGSAMLQAPPPPPSRAAGSATAPSSAAAAASLPASSSSSSSSSSARGVGGVGGVGALRFVGSDLPLPPPRSASAAAAVAAASWRRGVRLDPFASPAAALSPYTLLTGPPGVGKSALLQYAVAYARANGWIALAVPDAWALMRGGLVLVPSRRRPGFVDQHDAALRLLREARAGAHGALLARVPQRRRYAAFRYLPRALDGAVSASREALRRAEEEERSRLRAQAEAGGAAWDPASFASAYEDESDTASVDRRAFTLADMADWGLAHPAAATDTLLDLLAELRLCTEFPVMLAVDGHNLLYERTPYPMDGRDLMPEELSIPAALQCVGKMGFKPECAMKRGVFLGTVTQRHGRPQRMFAEADVKRAYRMPVPEATREEIHAQLLHYHRSQRFLMVQDAGAVDAFAVEYYKTLCSGRPRDIFAAAMYQV